MLETGDFTLARLPAYCLLGLLSAILAGALLLYIWFRVESGPPDAVLRPGSFFIMLGFLWYTLLEILNAIFFTSPNLSL